MRQTSNYSLEMFPRYEDDKGGLFGICGRSKKQKIENSPEPGERAEGKKTKTCQAATKWRRGSKYS